MPVTRTNGMACPDCRMGLSRVLDSRSPITELNTIQRRRECQTCAHRWTTFEIPMTPGEMAKLQRAAKFLGGLLGGDE